MVAKLIMTIKEMEEKENWLKVRKMGIGGSEASAVIGMNRYKSPRDVYLDKLNDDVEEITDNQYIYWGHSLEPNIANWFEEVTGKKVRKAGLMQSLEYPFMLASVDRLVIGEKAGLEIKTASGFKAKEWDGQEVPDEYYIQCQHYMAVTGFDKWYIAVLLGGNNAVWKEIPRNEDDIKALIECEKNFWNMVQNKIEPEANTEEINNELKEKYKGNGSKEPIILDDEYNTEAKEYIDIKNQIEDLRQKQLEYEVKFKLALEDNEVALTTDYEVKWNSIKPRQSLDGKKLKEELPDIYDKYLKTGAPSRRFSINIIK